jgi:tetratricopeptide (TPR) repeat protein
MLPVGALLAGSLLLAAPASFDDLARRADAARAAGRLDEARSLYGEALRLRPRWAEGLWYLGTLSYELDRFVECRDTFARLVALQPTAASAWALRGLCEFQLKEYDAARRHIEAALAAGPLESEAMTHVVAYHRALLAIRASAFDLAILPLTELVRTQGESPEAVTACGLVLLRRPLLPAEVPPFERELVLAAGAAYCAHLARDGAKARERYAVLLERYPRQRNVHYGWGLSLAQQGSPDAIAEFRREIELHPDHELAHVELAFNLLARGHAEEALAPAREAVRLAPGLFAARLVLGRTLAATGDAAHAVVELEAAVALAPDIPEVHLALARAYAQAGRKADADRANATFLRLDALRRGRPDAPPKT